MLTLSEAALALAALIALCQGDRKPVGLPRRLCGARGRSSRSVQRRRGRTAGPRGDRAGRREKENCCRPQAAAPRPSMNPRYVWATMGHSAYPEKGDCFDAVLSSGSR
jgi:hypothetical protein